MRSICSDDMSCIWIERLNLWVGQDAVKAHCEAAQGEFCRLWRGRGRDTCLLSSCDLLTGNHWFGRHIKLFWFIYYVSELHICRTRDHNSSQIHVCWRGLPSCQVRHVTAQLFYISRSPCLDPALLASKTMRNKCLFILQALSLWNSVIAAQID